MKVKIQLFGFDIILNLTFKLPVSKFKTKTKRNATKLTLTLRADVSAIRPIETLPGADISAIRPNTDNK